MLTVSEAVKKTGKTRQWLSKMAKDGRIKSIRKGFNGYLFPDEITIKPVTRGRPRLKPAREGKK